MRNDYHDGVLAINSANADAHDSDELMQRIVDNALTLRGLAMGAMVHLSYLAQDLPAGCSHSASEQVDILMAETTAILDAAEQSLAFLDRIERPTPAMRDRDSNVTPYRTLRNIRWRLAGLQAHGPKHATEIVTNCLDDLDDVLRDQAAGEAQA